MKKFNNSNVASLNIIPGITPVYNIVAKKLINGHIMHTVVHIIAVSTIIGLYSFGLTAFNANLTDNGLPINISVRYAKQNSIGINLIANDKSTFKIPPLSILKQ